MMIIMNDTKVVEFEGERNDVVVHLVVLVEEMKDSKYEKETG